MTEEEEGREEEKEGTRGSLLACGWLLGVVSLFAERGKGLELVS